MDDINNTVHTVNAAATAIVTAESRVQPTAAPVRLPPSLSLNVCVVRTKWDFFQFVSVFEKHRTEQRKQ
ncbi:hypothetical protein TanjilG_20142 [Lupinus angustifolius]|uniref:Uncharacterized protein n=1 Tax=Lupinus angustifolius TaxID=3871 RepID=A0A4P1RCM7_LUPAN|nr:hypothetical protein TanjilG_20142 [Lupinus angustifolius]